MKDTEKKKNNRKKNDKRIKINGRKMQNKIRREYCNKTELLK